VLAYAALRLACAPTATRLWFAFAIIALLAIAGRGGGAYIVVLRAD
jgi:hypothetical protein